MYTQAKKPFLRLLQDAGVAAIFGNPGTTEFPLLDAVWESDELPYYLALHDSVAVGMAHGYTLVSGKPTMVNLHAGPGLANAMGNLYNAYHSRIPLLVTAGQIDTRLQLFEPPLYADLVELARPVTKWAYQVERGEDLITATWRALKIALTPPYGPVFLSLPYDVLDHQVPDEFPPFERPVTARRVDDADLRKAVEILRDAESPVFVVGDGVDRARAVQEVTQLAEVVGARVYAERIPPTASFPPDHPQYFGSVGASAQLIGEKLARADVLVLVGASRLVPVVYGPQWRLPAGTRVIQIDEDSWELGKVFPYTVGILANPKEVLPQLTAAVASSIDASKVEKRKALLAEENRRWREETERKAAAEADSAPMAVSRVVEALKGVAPSGTVIIDESLTSTRELLRHYPVQPGHFYGIKGTGLGWGLPAAVGAQLASPDRPVVAFLGDGASLYSIQALWSAARYGARLVVIICNNRSYRILKEGMKAYRGKEGRYAEHLDLNQPPIDFVSLSQSLGVAARRVSHPGEVADSLQWAFSHGPAVVEFEVKG